MQNRTLEPLLKACRSKGSDKQFIEWTRRQPSAYSGEFSEWVNGEGRNPACHIRRANSSGTGFKAAYHTIPLTHAEHLLTHQKGESALMPKEWFEVQLRLHLELWLES